MNLQELRDSGRIIFSCVSGSHAYGTATPTSDKDIRGIYVNPQAEYMGLSEPAGQISDDKNDITYYSLKRIFELLQTANPNIIELLYMPKECVEICTPVMQKVIDNRNMFISKKCWHSHSGYAFSQIKKAKGQNKMVHNPQPETMPVKEDFCFVVPSESLQFVVLGREVFYNSLPPDVFQKMPCRPVPIPETKIDLSQYHCARLEQCEHFYRLYYYGKEAKGVFRGNDMLVPESIPLNDERTRFVGLLIYNQHLYDKALRDWHTYWDWKKNRNEQRWLDQEKGALNYDAKNLMHCMRLLYSGENILKNGEPIVRFEGDKLKHLLDIRFSRLPYEDVMSVVEAKMAEMEAMYETSIIPWEVNRKSIERLYRELTKV